MLKPAATTLQAQLNSPDETLRLAAIAKVGESLDNDFIGPLVEVCASESWPVRLSALEVLSLYPPQLLLPSLEQALRNNDDAGMRSGADTCTLPSGDLTRRRRFLMGLRVIWGVSSYGMQASNQVIRLTPDLAGSSLATSGYVRMSSHALYRKNSRFCPLPHSSFSSPLFHDDDFRPPIRQVRDNLSPKRARVFFGVKTRPIPFWAEKYDDPNREESQSARRNRLILSG